MLLQGSLADLNAALDTLRFTATTSGAAGIDITVDDLGNSGSGGARQVAGAVMITVGNDVPPTLALSQNTLVFAENDAPTLLDPGLTLADVDNPTLASAAIRIAGGYVATQDQLLFTGNPATMGNVTGSYSAGVLTLASAGATATLAQWEAALRSVAYANSSEQPDTTPRTLRLTVNDGIADSAVQLLTINLAAVNDAPLLGGANDLAAIAEDEANNFGTLVSSLIAGQISDVDAMAQSGIAVTGVDDSHGAWQFSTNGGASWSAFGAVSDGAARLLGTDTNTLVRFVPLADWNGSVPNGLVFRAWDQTSGTAGGTADASSNGANTAFSSATASSGITLGAVNDAPVLVGANSLAAIAEDATGNPGTRVSELVAAQSSDVDAAALAGIAITGADSSIGRWQYSTNAGASWQAIGPVSDGSARLLAADANTFVRLVPNTHWNGSVAAALSFRAWDQTTGAAGGVADATASGATTAFSSAVASSGITVSAVNDAPALGEAIIDQAATQGATFSFQIPVDSFSEIDLGDTLSYAATLPSGAALPAWLGFDGATRTFSGTPANADVASLVLRVTARDAVGASVSSDFTLIVANINDAPFLAAAIGSALAVAGTPLVLHLPSAAFVDSDVGDTLHYAATRSDGSVLPTWLAFDAATRTFSGTPADADAGQILVTVTATDGTGQAAQGTFGLVVSLAPVVSVPAVVSAPIADTLPLENVPVPAGTTVLTASAESSAAVPASAPVTQAVAELLAAPALQTAEGGPALSFAVEAPTLADAARPETAQSSSGTHLANRSEAVLSEAVTAQFNQLSASSMNQLLRGDELARRFEEMQRQMQQQGESRGAVTASTILATSVVSIGYVVWLVRGGVLMSSMLSVLPAWQMVDPFPVLAASRAGKGSRKEPSKGGGKTIDPEDADLERYFDDRPPPASAAPAAPAAPVAASPDRVGADGGVKKA